MSLKATCGSSSVLNPQHLSQAPPGMKQPGNFCLRSCALLRGLYRLLFGRLWNLAAPVPKPSKCHPRVFATRKLLSVLGFGGVRASPAPECSQYPKIPCACAVFQSVGYVWALDDPICSYPLQETKHYGI